MKPITTTLNAIRAHQPCEDGWEKLLKNLGKTKADDEPLKFLTILESNGIDDALWCLRSLPESCYPKIRHLAADYAERVLSIWENWAKDNLPGHLDVPRESIQAARDFADGKISQKELDDAGAAARAAAGAAARAAGAAARAAGAAERKIQAELLIKYFG